MYTSRMNAQVTKEVTFTKESVTALVFIISTQRLSKLIKISSFLFNTLYLH